MQFRPRNENVSRSLLTGLVGLFYCGALLPDAISGPDWLLGKGWAATRCELGKGCEAVAPGSSICRIS